MIDGILNLNKPRGPTSHDIVNRVRALTGIRRVGHAGTLDPLATGVLLICIGRATRVAEYLMAGRKVYRACVQLGVTTDTYDAEGQVVSEVKGVPQVDRDRIESVLADFRGTISQVPPMYSAIKHKGTPLHRLARQGIEVRREPRQVEIFRLELTTWKPPDFTLEVECSSGTYVRSLAHDLGQALACGAHLTGLTRLASGEFRQEASVSLEGSILYSPGYVAGIQRIPALGGEPEAIVEPDAEQGERTYRWPDLLHPIDAALTHFPSLRLDARAAQKICSGQAVDLVQSPPLEGKEKSVWMARAYGPDNTFLALVKYDGDSGVWRPHKVFYTLER